MNYTSLLLLFMGLSLTAHSQSSWPDSLNTANNVDYLNQQEKDVFLEMNKLRSNPKRYAEEYIKPMMATFKGNSMIWQGEAIQTTTREGVGAVKECYETLLKTKPMGVIHPSAGMYKAAHEHVTHQQKTGSFGHIGENKSDPDTRLKEYGQWEITVGENISYGCNSGAKIVRSLIIDDGVSNRGHRLNTLNPAFRVAGVAYAPHPKYQQGCVINLAGGFTDK